MADRLNRFMLVAFVVLLLITVTSSVRRIMADVPDVAAPATRTVLSDHDIQMIVAPSGTPIVLYDPARKRLMLIVGSLPRDTDVCINKRCLLDTSWTLLADRPDR